jgi:hypothetical protein
MPASSAHQGFPPLPLPTDPANPAWPSAVANAHTSLTQSFMHTQQVLQTEEAETLRLKYHRDQIIHDQLPILQGMEATQLLPRAWLEAASLAFGKQVVQIDSIITELETQSAPA